MFIDYISSKNILPSGVNVICADAYTYTQKSLSCLQFGSDWSQIFCVESYDPGAKKVQNSQIPRRWYC